MLVRMVNLQEAPGIVPGSLCVPNTRGRRSVFEYVLGRQKDPGSLPSVFIIFVCLLVSLKNLYLVHLGSPTLGTLQLKA